MDINQLKRAGFTDDEIQSYASSHPDKVQQPSTALPIQDKSDLLKRAGFSDDEVKHYYAQTPEVATPPRQRLYPAGVPTEAELPSRSTVAAIPPALLRGAAQSVRMLGQVGKALPIGGEETIFEPVVQQAKTWLEHPSLQPSRETTQDWKRRWLEQGGEAMVTSVAPQIIGGLIGGPKGWVIAGQITPAIFGLSEYQDVLDEAAEQAKRKGQDPEQAKKDIYPYAVASGTIEWGGESLANYLGAKYLGLTGANRRFLTAPLKRRIKDVLKPQLTEIGKRASQIIATETGTEMGQSGFEEFVRQAGGLESDTTPFDAAIESFGPALVMTALFGLGGAHINRTERKKFYHSISNQEAPLGERIDATRAIRQGLIEESKALAKTDPETAEQYRQLAEQWDAMTRDAINQKQPINIDQTILESTEGYKPKAKALPEEELTLAEEKKQKEKKPTKKEKPGEQAVPIEDLIEEIESGAIKTQPEIQGQVEPEKAEGPIQPTPPPEPGPEPVSLEEELAGMTDEQIDQMLGLTETEEKVKKPKLTPPEGLSAEQLRYRYEIQELRDMVDRGEAGKRQAGETGGTAAWGSSFPNFMKNEGWTKKEVLNAIDKAMAGEALGSKQQEIWKAVKNEARGIFKDRLGEQKRANLQTIPTGELDVGDKIKVKDEVLTVTEKDEEKIVIQDGQKYELDPYFDKIEGRKIEGKKEAVSTKEPAPITLKSIIQSGKKSITEDELNQLPDVVNKTRTPEEMREYLEIKGITVKTPVPAIAETPEPNMVRFYHGGIPGEGPRWVSPDYEYARGYAAKTPGAIVQYIDVPQDSPMLTKAFDDTGTTQKAPYVSFEATAEMMKGAKTIRTPELSPTEKDQYKLPGVKIGIEGKKPAEKGPTLEGTPLMEAAIKEEKEKAQPGLKLEEKLAQESRKEEEIKPEEKPVQPTPEEFKKETGKAQLKLEAEPLSIDNIDRKLETHEVGGEMVSAAERQRRMAGRSRLFKMEPSAIPELETARRQLEPLIERYRPATPEELKQLHETIAQILPEGTAFDFVDEIWIDKNDPRFTETLREWSEMGKVDGIIPGMVRYGGVTYHWNTTGLGLISAIEVATKGFGMGEVSVNSYHEAWHTIRPILTAKERQSLDAKFTNKEKEAEAFGAWATGQKLQPMSIRTIFEKVKQFLQAFGNYLKGNGWNSVESIFEKAYQGRIPGQVRETSQARREAGVWKREGEAVRGMVKIGEASDLLPIRYLQIKSKDYNDKVRTVILKNVKESDRFISGIQVNREGDEIQTKGADRTMQVIDRDAILSTKELRMSRKYGELLELPEETAQLKVATPQDLRNVTSVNPEVERRMTKVAYGLDQTSRIEKAKGETFKLLHSFTRHFEHLSSQRFGKVIDILYRFERVPEFAKKEASDRLKEIIGKLDKPKLNIFGRVLILNDLIKDYESGLYNREAKLPFGYNNIDEVRADLGNFEGVANNVKDIRDALAKRKEILGHLTDQLVAYEILPEAAKKDDRYYHHQVLQYMAIKAYHPERLERKMFTGLSPTDVRLHRKGWQIAREGSALDFNTKYIESEFEVFSQMVAQIETIKTLDRLQDAEDISAQLKEKAKEEGKKASNWKEYLPEGYTTWQPKRGFNFYMANTITDKLLEKVLDPSDMELYKATGKIKIPGEGFSELDVVTLKRALAVGKRRAEWAIPIELSRTLDGFRDYKDEGPIFKAAQMIQTSWKQWILLNTLRVVKYNLNNLSGDMDIALAYDPKIVTKYAKQAMIDLYHQLRNQPLSKELQAELKEAFRGGVIGSGITVHEIPDISKAGAFKILTGERPNLIMKYWNTTKDYTNFRENILRLASYRFFKDELARGSRVYGASKQSEIDAIDNLEERAAKLARELIGDYGNISKSGQWLRKNLIPFYSWMEINAPRYVRLMQNMKHEGKRGQMVGLSAAKTAKLGVRMLLLYALVSLWNHTFFPDEEEELGRSGRRQLHLILGRRSDGTIRSLRFQGALSDALGWFGLEDFPEDFKDVVRGKVPWTKKLEEALWGTPERLFQGARPIEKGAMEVLTGKALYPEMRKPKPVRDKIEHMLRTVSLDLPYKYVTGKPTRGILKDIESLATYTTDPGEAAYYDIINKERDFLEQQGMDIPSFSPTKKSNILYYYKQAQKMGDKKAAQKYMDQYIEAGGNKQDLMKSIKKSHPLGIMPIQYRKMFLETLGEDDQKELDLAVKWWQKTYGG